MLNTKNPEFFKSGSHIFTAIFVFFGDSEAQCKNQKPVLNDPANIILNIR